MSARRVLLFVLGLALLLGLAAACAPAAAPTQAQEPREAPSQAQPTPAGAVTKPTDAVPAATQAPPVGEKTPDTRATPENRVVELEWPLQMRLGNSDVVRLALVPVEDGYEAQVEFPEHALQTKPVAVKRPEGYSLTALAKLNGVNFEIEPAAEQASLVPPGEAVAWRWSLTPVKAGQQRLSVSLALRWEPDEGVSGPVRESQVFDKGIQVRVRSFLGLSPGGAGLFGVVGMVVGGGLALTALLGSGRGRRKTGDLALLKPNPAVQIQTAPGQALSAEERDLLQALFTPYQQVVVEDEFLSGYSGARTVLIRPVHRDGRADALTIVKLGSRASILREYSNYETYVKDRLPPVTARIQRPPVGVGRGQRAAVQYTFIAEPNQRPASLRQALLEDPDPALLLRLFNTFGPHWWMQRRASTFRLEQEYDAFLPPHYVLEPAPASREAIILEPETDPRSLSLKTGDGVQVRGFYPEARGSGRWFSLEGQALEGRPVLRLRWMGQPPPARGFARVTNTRMGLLNGFVAGFERFGLPDPLAKLPGLLAETVQGTCSVIHGDLNLENILVGPGNLVWLIDFAQTREGHPLLDFAHLEAEIIAHVLAAQVQTAQAFLDLWRAGGGPLVKTLHGIAARCLLDPANPREYHLALTVACLGALKYPNLSPLAKHCLYLAAAELAGGL